MKRFLLSLFAALLILPGIFGTTQTATTLSATSDKKATAYWVLVARGATAPTPAEVKARTDYSSGTIVASGTGAMVANVATMFAVNGLLGSTDYDLYGVAEDGDSNISAAPVKVLFSTALNTYAITVGVSQVGTSTLTTTVNAGHTFTG